MSALQKSVCKVLESYEIKPFSFSGTTAEYIYDNMSWYDNEVPDKDEFLSKVEDEKEKYLMELLREKRNVKLSECDWVILGDVSLDNIEEWKSYRQSLRDLPSNVVPTDEDMDALFPTKPGQ